VSVKSTVVVAGGEGGKTTRNKIHWSHWDEVSSLFFLSDLGFLAYQAGLTEGAGISVGSLDMGGASAQAGSKSIPKKYNLVKGKKLVIFGFILISNRKSMAILSLNN
jgi:hypothetical protein